MPSVRLTDTSVTVHLATGEKIGALSRDLVIPRSAIEKVEPVEHPIHAVRGIRAPGLAVPGRIKAGTWRRRGGKEFVAARRGVPGLRLHLKDHHFDSVLVSASNAEEVLAELQQGTG